MFLARLASGLFSLKSRLVKLIVLTWPRYLCYLWQLNKWQNRFVERQLSGKDVQVMK